MEDVDGYSELKFPTDDNLIEIYDEIIDIFDKYDLI